MTDQDYQNAVEWLYVQAPNYQTDGQKAYKPGLDNIRRLCEFFGNPQDQIKTIHIGGTNGKGSTSNMLASILQEAGYKVGLYNSPHLVDFTERIKINGLNADRNFVYDFINRLKVLPADIRPSFFEFTTVMAFEYFSQQKVDYAIIEVGLGGRLDATNIISPMLTAITNVALDHQNILGDTIEEIATEKAGIIKAQIPIISGDDKETVKRIIKDQAEQTGAEFVDATTVDAAYTSDLKGNYQQKNIKVVIALVEKLRNKGLVISEKHIENGLLNVQRNTHFFGRWFEFSQQPLTICDTAHNQAGLEEVFNQLNEIPKHKHMILGFVQDKKIDEVLQILPGNATYYFTKPYLNRGLHPKFYEEQLKKSKINYKIFDELQAAYLSAKQHVKTDEMIFIGGSNFIVGEFLEKNLQK
ncbi:bifunctional folylpolyglutamate synthase/dihydrofolate synthase [Chryseobacterium sp. 6424]|uniref:bifunctional folylpolyglutamate synthase/dihydrofolate synthase n=1 Tax=Chryseobacterium sp. 6424 TaxID=2039166 RepID=UPI000EFBABE9|nr:folylpolyglutamate synthase/dihydrofolate synthase family protein [Chryseobacterium sp. 6424]AYO56712.1 bifunctional folylpolyglutamate synthase/dihydrofolate synthase [Chryseobacterium sp. 6424]